MSPIDFAARLLTYCAVTRSSVSSWGRTRQHNDQVGGVEHSFHLTWNAADVIYDELPEISWAVGVALHLGLELIREPDHDHLEPLP